MFQSAKSGVEDAGVKFFSLFLRGGVQSSIVAARKWGVRFSMSCERGYPMNHYPCNQRSCPFSWATRGGLCFPWVARGGIPWIIIHSHRPYAISLYLTYLYGLSLMSSIPTTIFKSFFQHAGHKKAWNCVHCQERKGMWKVSSSIVDVKVLSY